MFCGMALSAKPDKDYRVYTILGDGELKAGLGGGYVCANFKLDNLCIMWIITDCKSTVKLKM